MPLHHTREITDMRFAYDQSGAGSVGEYSNSSDGERSYPSFHSGSNRSYQTEPSECSRSPAKTQPRVHYTTGETRPRDFATRWFEDRRPQESPRSSVASTIESDEELEEDLPDFDVPQYSVHPYKSSAVAASPSEFSELFPSSHRLAVRHDDATIDGNMNLRVDTRVTIEGQRCDMTLFHLRMHDLRNREFSLRRYCRDSGREVCHSHLKQQNPPSSGKRPGFQRSLSNALNSVKSFGEQKVPNIANLKRHDSGYGSMHSVDFDGDNRPRSAGQPSKASPPTDANTVKLEFSNYAQVDVKRTGVRGKKRYEFDYWGTSYSWRRSVKKTDGHTEVSYYLTKAGGDGALAFIVPKPLTAEQSEAERKKGGWIPPCSMWIANEKIIQSQKDLSDVVVAAGLMALVDGSIRARFHSRGSKLMVVPMSKLSLDGEYIGPKRLINEVFNRKDTASGRQSRPSSSRKSTDTRQTANAGSTARPRSRHTN